MGLMKSNCTSYYYQYLINGIIPLQRYIINFSTVLNQSKVIIVIMLMMLYIKSLINELSLPIKAILVHLYIRWFPNDYSKNLIIESTIALQKINIDPGR